MTIHDLDVLGPAHCSKVVVEPRVACGDPTSNTFFEGVLMENQTVVGTPETGEAPIEPVLTTQILQGDALHLPLADQSVDLTLASPPYQDARRYGRDDIALDAQEWVDFMLQATQEALRVTCGLVLWVVSGVAKEKAYQAGP